MKKIYQLTCYVNALNKRSKEWESIYLFNQIYVGREGLKTAYEDFEFQRQKFIYNRTSYSKHKYQDVRGKCELHVPHVHKNGMIAYWGDHVLISDNPDKIGI
jgi:hypothetical protein